MRTYEGSRGWIWTSRDEGWGDFQREGVLPEGCIGEHLPRGKALLLRLKVCQERVKVSQRRDLWRVALKKMFFLAFPLWDDDGLFHF